VKRLSRRLVLRGAGAVLALPFLDAMEARAQSSSPRRLVLLFSPNGTVYDRWAPTRTATGFTLSGVLSPLAPFQSKLNVLGNLDMASALDGPGDGHQKGIGHLWTGVDLQPGTLFGTVDWASGPSVDQRLADVVGGVTRLRSLELGVQVARARVYDRMVYRAAGQPLPPLVDPLAVFETLFGDGDPVQAAKRRARRRSVLDAVLGEYGAVTAKVGAGDKRRLDAHATAVREVERRLEALGQPGPSCVRPDAPARPSLTAAGSYPELGRLQMDLLALALACDVTRVASLQWSTAASNVVFSWLGQSIEHHELSHRGDDDVDARAQLEAIHRWYAEQAAYLLGKLDTAQEADGSVLDHSLVLWGNELGKGNVHSPVSVPFVTAGAAGGAVRTDQFLETAHAPHNALLLAALHAFGVMDASFGDASVCPGPLPGLLA